jgi:hypothetical protein
MFLSFRPWLASNSPSALTTWNNDTYTLQKPDEKF